MRVVKLRASLLAATLVVVSLAGCGPPVDCPSFTSEFAASAEAGSTIDVQLTGLIPGCNAPDNWLSADTIHLQLVSVDTREAVLAEGKSKIASDGTATITLTIPEDTTGTVSVEYDGSSLGTVTITD